MHRQQVQLALDAQNSTSSVSCIAHTGSNSCSNTSALKKNKNKSASQAEKVFLYQNEYLLILYSYNWKSTFLFLLKFLGIKEKSYCHYATQCSQFLEIFVLVVKPNKKLLPCPTFTYLFSPTFRSLPLHYAGKRISGSSLNCITDMVWNK